MAGMVRSNREATRCVQRVLTRGPAINQPQRHHNMQSHLTASTCGRPGSVSLALSWPSLTKHHTRATPPLTHPQAGSLGGPVGAGGARDAGEGPRQRGGHAPHPRAPLGPALALAGAMCVCTRLCARVCVRLSVRVCVVHAHMDRTRRFISSASTTTAHLAHRRVNQCPAPPHRTTGAQHGPPDRLGAGRGGVLRPAEAPRR